MDRVKSEEVFFAAFLKEAEMDRGFVERNKASTERLRKLVGRLKETDMGRRVGADWTVAVALAHLAFWDRRVQFVLDRSQKAD